MADDADVYIGLLAVYWIFDGERREFGCSEATGTRRTQTADGDCTIATGLNLPGLAASGP